MGYSSEENCRVFCVDVTRFTDKKIALHDYGRLLFVLDYVHPEESAE